VSDKLRLLSLFAGIGGFELGLERSGGFQTVAQCEIDPYCNKVLARHWPEVKRYGDIRELTADRLAADGIAVDAICGGFPCQDASIANTIGTGTAGKRTGLYVEFVRLIRDLRPRVVFMENVAELLNRGFGDVLAALARIGYDAEWEVISASALGAPHQRERLWIIAYPSRKGRKGSQPHNSVFEPALAAFPQHGHHAFDEWRSLDQDRRPLRNSDGISVAVERRRVGQSGNAVVPQIPELLGRAYLQAMETTHV
jgi:DNA (cytosine-5)-methyltransferase 1